MIKKNSFFFKIFIFFFFLLSFYFLVPKTIYAQVVDYCVRKDCDNINFNPGHLVCIELLADGSTKPGVDTGEICKTCVCSPGQIKYDCYDHIPEGWCPDETKINQGRGAKLVCNDDCMNWTQVEVNCYPACTPPTPQVTPQYYSFEKSVGATNELLEGNALSGTRDVPIDDSQIDNFGALSVLIPNGGPEHELKVNFVINYSDYKVTLGDGTQKTSLEIWNECTQNGALGNWRAYIDKLDECQNWGFIPNTYRKLASTPALIQTKSIYFLEEESPFVRAWTFAGFSIPIKWITNLFRSIFCGVGLFCPPDNSIPVRNPDNLSGWQKGKPNVPEETISNAQLLRQFLLPEGLSTGDKPAGDQTYFDVAQHPQTNDFLDKTGRAAQEAAADGGLFQIFQPEGIPFRESKCQDNTFNPAGGCASDFYFRLDNASPGTCMEDKTCYVDTPDQKTDTLQRLEDDRPLLLRRGVESFQKNLWPEGLFPN